MTKRLVTGRAIVSPCPLFAKCQARFSSHGLSDGGNSGTGSDRSRLSMNTGDLNMQSSPLTMSIAQATAISGLSESTVYRLIKRGSLESIKIGRRHLVCAESIKRLLQAA